MSDNNTSTLGSYVDSAKGVAQSALGAVTGSDADKAQAEDRKAEADAKYEASHTAAKLGPFTASSSGAVAEDDPDRSDGSWNQTVGSGKEAIGGLVGSESLKQSGQQQNQEGKAQEAQGQLRDLGSGVGGRVQGAVGGAIAGITGDRTQQQQYQEIHDEGKARQRGVEADLDKQANP